MLNSGYGCSHKFEGWDRRDQGETSLIRYIFDMYNITADKGSEIEVLAIAGQ
jgi:hypothetical protein